MPRKKPEATQEVEATVVDETAAAPAATEAMTTVDKARAIVETKAMPGYVDVGALIKVVLDKGDLKEGVEALDKLVALNERVADRQARQEFNAALARFQQRCPEIPETARADIDTRGGLKNFSYTYTKLKDLIKVCRPLLYEEGFSFRWDTGVTDQKHAFADFILTHVAGHETRSHHECPVEGRARMSDQQKHSSANTTCKRRSMLAGLGIQTVDDLDDDGADPKSEHKITDEQEANLQAVIEEVKANVPKFLAFFKVQDLEDLRQSDYDQAMRMLQAKRQQS